MKKLNIGIVGTGGMAKIHATAYMKNPSVKVTGVCSITRELSERFARGDWESVAYSEGDMEIVPLYAIDDVYEGYREMARDPRIDAVSITTPNALHYEIALEMLRNKKHILVEKPMATNAADAEALVAEARRNGVLIATGHMWRYHADVEFIRHIVQSGMLGEIVQTKAYSEHLRWAPGGWFAERAQAGGGALIDMGVHAIDTARYILGDPDIKSVYASVGTRFTNAEVDDFGQIMIKHKNGVVSLFETGWNFPVTSGGEASAEFWGADGYARLFPTSATYRINGRWGSFTPDVTEAHMSTMPYQRQIDDFAAAAAGGGECRVGFEVGLNIMKICDAAYRSSEEDCVVRF